MTRLETERLVLRRWREDDLAPMAEINSDPEVMRWIGDGQPRSLESTKAAIARSEQQWEELGYGWFAVEIRSTGEFAGLTGLGIPDDIPDVMPAVEIGWRLSPRFWRKGLATEGARAALRFAFLDRDMTQVVGIHQIGNYDSERVMEKLGMRLIGQSTEPPLNRPVRIHAINRAEYDVLNPS